LGLAFLPTELIFAVPHKRKRSPSQSSWSGIIDSSVNPAWNEDDLEDDNVVNDDTRESEGEIENDGLVEGMDPSGFAGPSERVVKPLTQEALMAFQAAQARTGIIYISRIPPGMQPPKVRHLMSAYGEVGRVYLQREGE